MNRSGETTVMNGELGILTDSSHSKTTPANIGISYIMDTTVDLH